jgi:hypothetical protein
VLQDYVIPNNRCPWLPFCGSAALMHALSRHPPLSLHTTLALSLHLMLPCPRSGPRHFGTTITPLELHQRTFTLVSAKGMTIC